MVSEYLSASLIVLAGLTPVMAAPLRWLFGIVEWKRPGGLVKIGGPVAVVLAFGGLAFWGGSTGVIVTGGGRTTTDAAQAASVDWHCDFGYAAGDSSAAVRGTSSTGTGGGGSGGITECFGASTASITYDGKVYSTVHKDSTAVTADWPTGITNVLRVAQGTPSALGVAGNPSGMLFIDSIFDPSDFAVGTSAFFRLYWTDETDVGENLNTHSVHLGSGGSGDPCGSPANCYSMFNHYQNTVAGDGTFSFNLYPYEGADGFDAAGSYAGVWNPPPQFATNTLYMQQWRFYIVDADSVLFTVRFDDVTNSTTDVITNVDFLCSTDSGNGCQAAGHDGFSGDPWYLGQQKFPIPDGPNYRRFVSIELGNNGVEALDPSTAQAQYFGGFAARLSADSSDWIGAYPVGSEAN